MKPLKPRAGSLPLVRALPSATSLEDLSPEALAAQSAPPPFGWDDAPEASTPDLKNRSNSRPMSKLGAARKKVEQLTVVARDEAFDDWVRRCLKEASRPEEWSQSRVLYESYLKHAATYGSSRGDRALSKQVAATETRFGKMMGSLFHKTRRTRGWYYPVKIKRGA
jgi:hypothetical protein